MDERNGICAVNSDFPRTSSNDICLVLFLKFLAPFVILVRWENTYEDAVEFGEACGERSRNLVESEICVNVMKDYFLPYVNDGRNLGR